MARDPRDSREEPTYPERRGLGDRPGGQVGGREATTGGSTRAAYDEQVGDDRTRQHPVLGRHDDRPLDRDEPLRDERVYDEARARDKFGGVNVGAGFFGWLVAVGMATLLTGLLAVVATLVGYSNSITISSAARQAGTVTLVTALVLLVVLLVAYYSGGYVAGRMSRFDGGRQGFVVWLIGTLVTVAAAVLGVVAGQQYDVLGRVNAPRIPFPVDQVTTAGLITVAVVLVTTLLAAMIGGKVGRRYHARVDRAAY
ncbi:MAG: hypothetical protein JWR20_810 [Marmoricola sp.]|nr:hypothetical protein [Marmoricola sp.]